MADSKSPGLLSSRRIGDGQIEQVFVTDAESYNQAAGGRCEGHSSSHISDHEMVTTRTTVTPEGKLGADEEHHGFTAESSRSIELPRPAEFDGGFKAITSELRVEGAQGAKAATLRAVADRESEPSSVSADEGIKPAIYNILHSTSESVPVVPVQNGNAPSNEDSQRAQERVLPLTTSVSGGKKRKVSCIVDYDPSLHRDLEMGTLPEGSLKGRGAVVAAERLDDGDEEDSICRVCHNSTSLRKSDVIDLGCACKHDLGRAHRDCAETWFRVRGNRICEICGQTAQNVNFSEPDGSTTSGDATITIVALSHPSACWQYKPIRTFIIFFLVAAFLVPWLFRFAYYR